MKYLVLITVLTLSITSFSVADTFMVSSQAEFDDALDHATENDTIMWKSGAYSDIFMDITDDHLVIMAEEPGGTIFRGSSRAEVRGDYIRFSGFQYVDGDIGTSNVIETWGSYNHFTELNISGYTSYKYFVIRAECQYDSVSYSNFENRVNLDDQNILSILVDSSDPGYHVVRYCSFKNFDGTGGDMGIEPIRIGVSSQAEFISRSTVEYCYFTQCNGDGEIISNKAKQNVYRYNTFEDNPEAELVLRHGDEGIVYGNFFLGGMGGIRMREGQGHLVYNNYFNGQTSRSVYIQSNSTEQVDDVVIAYNTFVNTEDVRFGGSGGTQPENILLANNIFSDPSSSLFSDASGLEIWIGNIYSGQLGITEPSSGMTNTDPLLEANNNGYYGITEMSPAVDAAQIGYPDLPEYEGLDIDNEVLLDIMKQDRPTDIASKDVGCSEFPISVDIEPFATEENTGPSYTLSGELFDLVINLEGEGTVTTDPVGDAFDPDTEVNLVAAPAEGYSFDGWDLDLSGNEPSQTITMDSDKEVTARFTKDVVCYSLTINIEGGGTVITDPDLEIFETGTVVNLTAEASDGYFFDGWSGDLSGNTITETITMDSDKVVTVLFTRETIFYTLTINVSGEGSVTSSENSTTIESGTAVDLTAIASDGYVFEAWSGDLSGSDNPETLTMDSDKNITATFSEIILGTEDINQNNEISLKIFPNPVVDRLELSFVNQTASIIKIDLYDFTGKRISTIMNEHVSAGEFSEVYELSNLQKGLYILQFKRSDSNSGVEAYETFRLIRN